MENTVVNTLIIGAGLSGLGMAYTMKTKRPSDSFVIIEGRDSIGGTWDLFRYPGIRSDSDMYSFAYSFKPWKSKNFIGSGDNIMNYLREFMNDNNIEQYIRYKQRVTAIEWDSSSSCWKATISLQDKQSYVIYAHYIVSCCGYYNYKKGYTPKFNGTKEYSGQLFHAQHWPQDLDYNDKSVLVIGSGATAATVVPSIASKAKHVTMLQRSPTFMLSAPSHEPMYEAIYKYLPEKWANKLLRHKYIWLQQAIYICARAFPNFARRFIRNQNQASLNGKTELLDHFKPSYNVWDQRLCNVPDSDFFKCINSGQVSVQTDEIDTFTQDGVLLKSGKKIKADITVLATGLNVEFFGGMRIVVDKQPLLAKDLTTYKGVMFSGIPNFFNVMGYTNAPWTLKAELSYNYYTRLRTFMDKHHYSDVFPQLNDDEQSESLVSLQANYLLRVKDQIPKQGAHFPWRNKDLYLKDRWSMRYSKLNDGILKFNSATAQHAKPTNPLTDS